MPLEESGTRPVQFQATPIMGDNILSSCGPFDLQPYEGGPKGASQIGSKHRGVATAATGCTRSPPPQVNWTRASATAAAYC